MSLVGRRLLPIAAVVVALTVAACGSTTPETTQTPAVRAPARGGDLIVSVRAEPKSLSWYTQHDATTDVVTFLTQARLVRVDRRTQEIEPWLAEGWTRSDDG